MSLTDVLARILVFNVTTDREVIAEARKGLSALLTQAQDEGDEVSEMLARRLWDVVVLLQRTKMEHV